MSEQPASLPNGFRDTPLGPLPEEWQVVRLGEALKSEAQFRRQEIGRPSEIPFLPMALIPEDSLYITRWELRKSEEIRSGILVYEGDFLLAKITPCLENGKQGIVARLPNGWGIATTEVIPIRTSEVLLPEFLALYLKQSRIRRELADKMEGTTGRQRLPKSVVRAFLISLPPLPEQRAIAHVLTSIQRAIEATEQVIAATRELKKSLMRHLFTYGPVSPAEAESVPLQETEIGPLPVHWRVVRLGEVTNKPEYGYTASAVNEAIGPKFLRITDIQNGVVNWATVPYCQCSKDDEQRYKLETGDILVARIGATTGKTYLVKDCPSSVFASYLIRIRCKSTLLPDFFSQLAETQIYWDQINASKGGRLKQGVNIPVLQNLLLPLPPLPEQQRIAEILAAVDEKLQAEERRKAALQSLFRSMLHHLMTGKVRVAGLVTPPTQPEE